MLRGFPECAALVGGDVVGPVAFDLVLRIIRRRVMSVTLVIEVAVVDFHDRAADVAGFRIPGDVIADFQSAGHVRSEEHTSELQSLMRISYAVFCLKKKKNTQYMIDINHHIPVYMTNRNKLTQ